MLDDSDVHWHRQIKACVGGVAAAVVRRPCDLRVRVGCPPGPRGRWSCGGDRGPGIDALAKTVGPEARLSRFRNWRKDVAATGIARLGEYCSRRVAVRTVPGRHRSRLHQGGVLSERARARLEHAGDRALDRRTPYACRLASPSQPEGCPKPGALFGSATGRSSVPTVAWRPVRWWDPRPDLSTDDLVRHGSKLLEVLGEQPSFRVRIATRRCAGRSEVPSATGDVGPALEVIGLGPGLTPAADDVVAGALAVLALCGRLHHLVTAAVDLRASTHTTALSAALLAAAGKGQVIPQAAASACRPGGRRVTGSAQIGRGRAVQRRGDVRP